MSGRTVFSISVIAALLAFWASYRRRLPRSSEPMKRQAHQQRKRR
jgi:hypothetical protein